MAQAGTTRMWDTQYAAIVTWLADKLARHATSIAIGALGGIVAALRRRHTRIGAIVKYGVVGGLVAPFTGTVLREFGVAPGYHDAAVFTISIFAIQLLDILSDALDAARTAIERRVVRAVGGDE